ncbi:hypothetical protein ACTFBT_00290 [Streptomyces microflavus]|uniref:hypothetical protein n=1 Tax=Streptomyces TaxID=1883 RepID=UPI0008237F94|nr:MULTISPECIES: hypothetical protein [Streptomyces]MCX4657180.1 hypothetical protein [Streptomyces microflavus]MDX2982067.1 hypothetical protein [Streptomyces sp. NRRL_B-2249]WSS32151.1 hypothetical protein OG269_01120 [Streptomyces microflavus]WST19318.1 hypothetical protein OG721_37625 [Streptomyces microflavus]SCK32873.1 hypothetical protein YUYDRAFT_03805 [Streptomyces sp. ScaeMP-e48]
MSPADGPPIDPHSADASADGPGGQTSRPSSAAHARSEVEFALHPLLCAPDAHFRSAHQGGVDDALLVASELTSDALTRSGPGSSCELTCTLGRYEVTISVTGPYESAARLLSYPLGLRPGAGLTELRRRIVRQITARIQITRRTAGERIITATVPLTGPAT